MLRPGSMTSNGSSSLSLVKPQQFIPANASLNIPKIEMQRNHADSTYSLQLNQITCGPPNVYPQRTFTQIMKNPNRKPNTNIKKPVKNVKNTKKVSPFNIKNIGALATTSSSSLSDNHSSSISGSTSGHNTMNFIKVIVFDVESPEKFYLKTNATNASVDQFQKVCNRAGLESDKPQTIEVNETYLVNVEHRWYRGKVLNVESSKRYLVFFIDFGKQDYVEKSRLIPENFASQLKIFKKFFLSFL